MEMITVEARGQLCDRPVPLKGLSVHRHVRPWSPAGRTLSLPVYLVSPEKDPGAAGSLLEHLALSGNI